MQIKFGLKVGIVLSILILSGVLMSQTVLAKEGLSEDKIVNLINNEREKIGLPGLIVNRKLNLAANNKARDMINKQYWSHNSPDGTTPWVFIKNAGYSFRFAGENLAKGYRSEESLVDGWMGSELHRKNILNNNYIEIGIANVEGDFLGKRITVTVMMVAKKQVQFIDYWEKLTDRFQKRPNWLAVWVD